MIQFQLQGRGAYPGVISGEALVCPDSIAGNSGALGDTDGVIYEKTNVNYGKSILGKILVVPCAKGSNGFSAHFRSAQLAGVAPLGWIAEKVDGRLAVAIASMKLPAVCDFTADQSPLAHIQSGDWLEMDGSSGVITVTRKEESL